MFDHIIYYLETVMLHVFLNVDVCVYGSPQYFYVLDGEHIESKIMCKVLKTWVIRRSQYFDVLDGEHIENKIIRNVLKTWVILEKNFSPFVYVPSCGVLSQEHCFPQVKII